MALSNLSRCVAGGEEEKWQMRQKKYLKKNNGGNFSIFHWNQQPIVPETSEEGPQAGSTARRPLLGTLQTKC